MRKSFDALCGMVQQNMQSNILQGGVFIFVNRKRNQIKLLTWKGDGQSEFYTIKRWNKTAKILTIKLLTKRKY